MGRAIIKIKDRYFEWSTVVDAPVTYGMTLDELRTYIKEEQGRIGLEDLEANLKRIEEVGTSYRFTTADEVISGNHAGLDGTYLTKDQIYDSYAFAKPPTP